MSIDHRKAFGTSGEALAAAFLTGLGYEILAMGVRPLGGLKRGEIDLVARDREWLVFVEVKTRRRSSGPDGVPSEAVDLRKRRQLLRLAEAYIAKTEQHEVANRFDIVEVTGPPGAQSIRLLRHAFDANDAA